MDIDPAPDAAVKIKLAANEIGRFFLGEIPADPARARCSDLPQGPLLQVVNDELLDPVFRENFPISML